MPPLPIPILNWREARRGVSSLEGDGSDPSPPNADAIATTPVSAAGLTHFELAERLVQVWIRNQRNLNRLEELGARIEKAERRWASTNRGRALVEAHRLRLEAKRRAVLLRLRGDDRLASALLEEIEARRRVPGESPRAFSA